ncbi:P-loop containing nucleoside triphosphate hydrolase protein [Cladochytrium replicatum]|nr:P-loop containing nucleoside triphosphate hydrolase protein [Cladochytrium replicatum]
MVNPEDEMQTDEEKQLRSSVSKGKKQETAIAKDDQKQHLPWIEKYRPAALGDLISHQDIISTISRFIDENRLPHMLFYGPPGTGKTSTILAVARKLYGDRMYKSMTLEMNASDDRGIDAVRDQVKTFASTKTVFSTSFKLIILDEADAMTTAAQNALRRIIEQYTRNVRFCIICNYVSKIIPAIQSRCTRFRFGPLSQVQIQPRLRYVIESENVNISDDGMEALLSLSQGDMRRALNILQAAHSAFDRITADSVYACTGSPLPSDIERISDWMLNQDFETAFNNTYKLKEEKGLALSDIITCLYDYTITLELPAPARAYLLARLAEIEYNLSVACSEKIQLAALTGAFKLTVDLVEKYAST